MTTHRQNLRLYLDSSVIAFIADHQAAKRASLEFERQGWTGTTSYTALIEAARAPYKEWVQRQKVFASVVSELLHPPGDYLEAQEFLDEVRRLRPDWLKTQASTVEAKQLLRKQKEIFRKAQSQQDFDPKELLPSFLRVFEPAVSVNRKTQKELRSLILSSGKDNISIDLVDEISGSNLTTYLRANTSFPERFGRIASLMTWRNALAGESSLRDLRDWTSHWLNKKLDLNSEDFIKFWLREVDWLAMPIHRAAYSTSYFQLDYKISHGNAADVEHSVNGLRTNVFLTCDGVFSRVLADVRREFGPSFAQIVLVPRSAKDAIEAISLAMNSIQRI